VIFDGAGTQWPGVLSDEQHKSHRLYASVADTVAGACGYCAGAFDAKESLHHAKVHFIEDYRGHPSIRGLLADGYQGPDLLTGRHGSSSSARVRW
jgi:hypothetical protein